MRYVAVGDVLQAHQAEISPDPVVDPGLLESAVLRPQSTFGGKDLYPDIHTKAAVHSLIRNHPFVDGNKRTAVLAIALFYELNAWFLSDEAGQLVGLAVDTAEGVLDVDGISKKLAALANRVEP